MKRILHAIDAINERMGLISSWLVAILIFVILYEVIARYVFNSPTQWAFGTFTKLGGAIVVMGWAYAQRHNSHVRMDIFYVRFSARKRAFIDIIGTALFFFPIFAYFINFTGASLWGSLLTYVPGTIRYQADPIRVVYLTIVLLGLCLFFLQFVARFIRDIYPLTRGERL
jgi:TRAP-type mannitol/chloroaromatic compound transport system permease small subunit